MLRLLKPLLIVCLPLNGQMAFATPQDDARFIVERGQTTAQTQTFEDYLRKAFVTVYARPLSEFGIEIADTDQFMALIPDTDIAPYVERMTAEYIETYLSVYTPEQLAVIATLLRTDENATLKSIIEQENRQRYAAALAQAHADFPQSGSTDPLVIGIEEMTLQLDVFNTLFDDDGAEQLAQGIGRGMSILFTLMRYDREIKSLQPARDHPVTIAALKANGVLAFSNPVQRQTLLRQLAPPTTTGGIQFIKPPATSAAQN